MPIVRRGRRPRAASSRRRAPAEAAEAADRAAFERMTVAELKDLLRARGQRVGGKKADAWWSERGRRGTTGG